MRRLSHGTALLGGSPFRLIRLSKAGARMLDQWVAGDAGELSDAAQALRTRLLHAGMVHPVFVSPTVLPSIAFVVPVYNDVEGLRELLGQLRREFPLNQIVVVDDASIDDVAVQAIAEKYAATLQQHQENRGPAAARNTGWRLVQEASVVCFIDSDVLPQPGAIQRAIAHLSDPQVGAAAPRVRAGAGQDLLDSYEMVASPLDLGESPAIVRPGTIVSYVPSAALAIRRSALIETDGFDETMRVGEDVDLIWRLVEAGHHVRYEPAAVVDHRNRRSIPALLRQRFGYGSSAAALADKHGETVAPLRLPVRLLAGCLAAVFGGKLGLAAAAASAALSAKTLESKLDGKVDAPRAEAARLTVQAHRGSASAIANAATRSYLPLLLLSRRARPALLMAALLPALLEWWRHRPRHGPVAHLGLAAADDAAYCAGVWVGAWRARSVAALRPAISFANPSRSTVG